MNQWSTSVRIAESEPSSEIACLSVASLPEGVRTLRRQAMEILCSLPLSAEDLADVELALGEACSNAFKHGSPRGNLDRIRIRCIKRNGSVVIEVSDDGYGFDPNSVPEPSGGLRENGMGIFLMQALMDSVEFEFGAGTTVRLIKHCRHF